MNRYQKFDELIKHFVFNLGWERDFDKIRAGNLMVYYRDAYKEWRLRDTSPCRGTMDLTTINFPLDDKEKERIWSVCSYYFKEKPTIT